MTFRSCDGYFRALEEVNLRIGRPEQIFPNRRLQEEDQLDFSTFNTTNSTNATNATVIGNTTNTTTEDFYQVETYVGSTLFSVTGNCRDCPVSEAGYFNVSLEVLTLWPCFVHAILTLFALQIFDDAFRRRTLSETWQVEDDGLLRRHLLSSNQCFCPVGVDPKPMQAPTAKEFEEVYVSIVPPCLH